VGHEIDFTIADFVVDFASATRRALLNSWFEAELAEQVTNLKRRLS
jgi:exonuclease VII large subunit